MIHYSITFALSITALFAFPALAVQDQPVMAIGSDGRPVIVAAPTPGNPGTPGAPGTPSGTPPADGTKPPTAEAAKPGENADSAPKVIRRDGVKADPANAEELQKAVLGDDGKVAFEFRNQTWPELIEWLSALSAEPIDWQELPGDRVNITTPGRYSVDQVRDLLNRHLLGRGYTLLKLDGGLSVVKCEGINPSLVPRVDEADLGSITPHSFVRVLLDVGWLSSEKLAAELKPMISSNGKLTALTTTNRIEAMDSAISLLQVSALLEQERNSSSRESLAPEFKLRHLPAAEAKQLLEQFLGIEKKKDAPMTPEQMQMMQQMRNQGGQPPSPEPPKAEISVVANNRQNSIIIMAPPDRLAIASEFLKRIDVPSSSIQSLSDVQNRVQVFRLASLDPEKLIEIVQEMNILEPTTRTRVDNENRAVIVSGSAADRFIIDQLIQRLDGSGRQFEVLQLRRLDAGDVAESIAFLMGDEKEKEDSSRNRYSSYFFGGGGEEKKKKEDKFRVAANTRFRQVLLWANDIEMGEVRNLLVKLGELPPPEGDSRTVRLIEASPTLETLEYLRRLQGQWERISPNPIVLPSEDEFVAPESEEESNDDEKIPDEVDPEATPKQENLKEENSKKPASDTDTVAAAVTDRHYRFAAFQETNASQENKNEVQPGPIAANDEVETLPQDLPKVESAEQFDRLFGKKEKSPQPTGQPAKDKDSAPIRVEIDRAGNLMISSSDTQALDRLEGLMLQFSPPKRPYRVFKIKNASASWMALNLEDYFKDADDDKDSDADSFFRWYWGDGETEKKEEPKGLGKGSKLRFISDLDTNTIVVNGADAEQLATIEELIELWDVEEPVNKRKVRFTKLVAVKYGKAGNIAETVKDAYRDLLSGNDKAFQQQAPPPQDGGGKANNQPRSRNGNGSGLQDTNGTGQSGGSDFTFKGKLSVGVDEVGNTLLISAEGEPLLDLVCDMVKQLDDASRPSGDVQVVKLSGEISPNSLEAALRAFGASSREGKKEPSLTVDKPAKDERPDASAPQQ